MVTCSTCYVCKVGLLIYMYMTNLYEHPQDK